MKVSGGFISKESDEEKKRNERKTKDGYIIPGEFVNDAQHEIHGPVTREGLIVPGEFVDNRKTAEEKQYLIFYTAYDDGGDTYQSWIVCIGRTEAYRYIKTIADSLDFDNSFILVEGVNLENSASIIEFMEYAKQFYDDTFDINDYTDRGDIEEEDDDPNNVIFRNQKQNNPSSTEALDLFRSTILESGIHSPNMNTMLFEQSRRDNTIDEDDSSSDNV